MTDVKAKAKLEVVKGVVEDSVCTILNLPEILRYKDIDGEVKEIEIKRLSVFSLEKAIQPVFKLLSLVDLDTGEFMIGGLATLVKPEDMNNLKQVVVSCLNVTMDKFNSFTISLFMKIVNKWLAINRDEIKEFTKAFLVTREEIVKYKEVLDKINLSIPKSKN